jgi:hypothetical protein
MKRKIRNYIGILFFVSAPIAFVTHLMLFFRYMTYRPTSPQPELGLIYLLNNHGSYFYLNSTESASLRLLQWAVVACAILGISIVPKKIILPPSSTPRWHAYLSARFRTDFDRPSWERAGVVVASLFLASALIFLIGPRVVAFALSLGMNPQY